MPATRNRQPQGRTTRRRASNPSAQGQSPPDQGDAHSQRGPGGSGCPTRSHQEERMAIRRLAAPGPDQRAPGRRGQRRRRCPQATGPYKPRPARRRRAGQTARPRNQRPPGRRPTSPRKPRKRPTAGPRHAKARAKRGKRAKGDHRDERPARPTPTRNGARAAPRARRKKRERKGSEKRKKERKTWHTPKASQPPGSRPAVGAPRPRPEGKPPLPVIIAHIALNTSK